MAARFLIYGATGYTGKLCAQTAKAQGLSPILAGRNAQKVKSVAEKLGLDYRAFALEERGKLDEALREVDAVLHIAGPFSATARPMLDACLRTGRHYLDVTGELDVLEACAALDGEAKGKGIAVLPAVGFDVVPSDCLAAHVKRRLPDATRLTLAISGLGGMSRGTAKTGVEGIGLGTRARRSGRIVTLPMAVRREIDFGQGAKPALMVSWGDVATAYHSTGIPDIDVYFEASPLVERLVNTPAVLRWLLGRGSVQRVLKSLIDRQSEGPSEAERAAGRSILVAEAANAKGEVVRSRLTTPEAYTLTALTAIAAAKRAADGEVKPGFQTPSRAFGPDFILAFDGCRREDLNA